jgi:hypothetical protein
MRCLSFKAMLMGGITDVVTAGVLRFPLVAARRYRFS